MTYEQRHLLDQNLQLFYNYPALLKKTGLTVETFDPRCFSVQYKNQKCTSKKYDVFLSSLIHGNEVGGLGAVNAFLEFILNNPDALKSKILFHIANVEAAQQGQRFLEKDLNRSFVNSKSELHEEKLARKIENLVLQCAYNLDLHQTNSRSKTPFFIFSYHPQSLEWARYLDDKIPVITSKVERHKDGSTLDFFCLKNNIPSTTVELGEAGFFDTQISYGLSVLKKILNFKMGQQKPGFHNMYRVLETLYWTDERIILKEGFENFSLINKGDILGKKGTETYISPHTGAVLFPKYGKIAENTKELVTIAIEVQNIDDLDKSP